MKHKRSINTCTTRILYNTVRVYNLHTLQYSTFNYTVQYTVCTSTIYCTIYGCHTIGRAWLTRSGTRTRLKPRWPSVVHMEAPTRVGARTRRSRAAGRSRRRSRSRRRWRRRRGRRASRTRRRGRGRARVLLRLPGSQPRPLARPPRRRPAAPLEPRLSRSSPTSTHRRTRRLKKRAPRAFRHQVGARAAAFERLSFENAWDNKNVLYNMLLPYVSSIVRALRTSTFHCKVNYSTSYNEFLCACLPAILADGIWPVAVFEDKLAIEPCELVELDASGSYVPEAPDASSHARHKRSTHRNRGSRRRAIVSYVWSRAPHSSALGNSIQSNPVLSNP